ncbi:repressor LexA [Candidatus Berkelbacteria bacterium RIFOXYA2_FULL_43_10]|uniref:Repressor LexA n=1 Tax=Candidatus Berkelbacteria bacterium RIFOXYA2_FULL_43_10 TaxID=1797472 RepID=A0A1F5EDM1_9BACT|nr:MAG: repressor LexA [Candidatus Berkelbacteria bacterium RIFOXYA2_FULL_43_10]
MGVGKPSKRQAEILRFVAKFQRVKDYSPSLSEIAGHFKVSIPTIHQHIAYLRKKNLLSADKGKRRSIQTFNDQKRDLVEIPLMGLIAAGGPIEAIRNPEPIEVPRSMLPRGANYYALKIVGASMIEEGISDDDIVIVREQQTVDDGEKAVAYLPDKDAVTLKKIYREKKRIKLVPANKYMKPFYETNVEIQGKVVGVLRREI